MAALPQSNTERWWCVYTNNLTTHRVGIRTGDNLLNTQASTVFSTLFANLSPMLVSTQITGLERALKNSNVRIPFVYTGAQPTGAGTNDGNDRRARVISFTGRSLDGRKVKLFVFGITDQSQGDYRISTTENINIANEVVHLNNAAGVFLSISGGQPVWHSYANIGYNDHWIKEYRKG